MRGGRGRKEEKEWGAFTDIPSAFLPVSSLDWLVEMAGLGGNRDWKRGNG